MQKHNRWSIQQTVSQNQFTNEEFDLIPKSTKKVGFFVNIGVEPNLGEGAKPKDSIPFSVKKQDL
jgi:hypothetical protein